MCDEDLGVYGYAGEGIEVERLGVHAKGHGAHTGEVACEFTRDGACLSRSRASGEIHVTREMFGDAVVLHVDVKEVAPGELTEFMHCLLYTSRLSEVWAKGGEGALELADEVMRLSLIHISSRA